jgi:CheY-like chemotaxis protein
VAAHVRRNLADDHIQLIALTGYGQPADVQQALESGFDRHLVKPLNIEKLLDELSACRAAANRRPAKNC